MLTKISMLCDGKNLGGFTPFPPGAREGACLMDLNPVLFDFREPLAAHVVPGPAMPLDPFATGVMARPLLPFDPGFNRAQTLFNELF